MKEGQWCIWWQISDYDGEEQPVLCKVKAPHQRFENFTEVWVPQTRVEMPVFDGSFTLRRAETHLLQPIHPVDLTPPGSNGSTGS